MNFFISFLTSTRWAVPINLILASIIGYGSVEIGWLFFYPPVSTPTRLPSHPILSPSPPSQANEFNVQALRKAELFGKARKKVMAPPITTTKKTLPKTHLNLTLRGIYYSSNPLNSFAMISNAAGKVESYQQNELLPGGTIVSQIHPKHVILLRNGREEILYLLNEQASSKLSTQNAPTTRLPLPQKTTQKTEVAAQLLGQYQQQLRTEPQQLMKLFRVSPVKQSGRLIGYRVRPRRDSQLLSHFNLQTGDILTAVNGIPLNSHLNAFSVMQQIATTDQINLQILRNGQSHSYSFQIQ